MARLSELRTRIFVLESRLAAIHDAAERNLDERSLAYQDCECVACKRLRFILITSAPDIEDRVEVDETIFKRLEATARERVQ